MITVIELASAGPGPFAGMMLADHGARVVRIEPPDTGRLRDYGRRDIINRNREVLVLDLKAPGAIDRVLDLVAAGMTNGQIATKLFISTKTASVHVSNILAKVGASTRTEAVDVARQRGLLD